MGGINNGLDIGENRIRGQQQNRSEEKIQNVSTFEFFQAKAQGEELRPRPGHSQSSEDQVRRRQLKLAGQSTRN